MKWNILISSVILMTQCLICYAQMRFPWQRRPMFRPPLFPSGSLLRLNRNRFRSMNRRFPFSPNMPFGDRNAFMNRPDANRLRSPQNPFTPGNPNPAIPGPSTTGQANSNRAGNTRNMFPNSDRNTPSDITRFQGRPGSGTFSNFQNNARNRQVPPQGGGLPSPNNFPNFQGRRMNQFNMSPQQFGGSAANQRQFSQQSQRFPSRPQMFPQQPQGLSQLATRQQQLQQQQLQQQQLQQQQQQQQQISRFPMNPFSRQTFGRGRTNIGRRAGQMPLRPQGLAPITPGNQWRAQAMAQNNMVGNRNLRPGFDPIRNQVLTQTGRSNDASIPGIQSQSVPPTPPVPVPHILKSPPARSAESVFSSQQALAALGINQAESSPGSDSPPPPPGTQILPENFDPKDVPPGTEVQSMVTITNEKGDILYRGYDLDPMQIDKIANEIADNITKNTDTPDVKFGTNAATSGATMPDVTPPVTQILTGNAPSPNAVVKNPSILGESQTFAGSGSPTDPLASVIENPSGSTSQGQGAALQNSPFFQPPRVPARPRSRSRGPLQFLDVNQNTGTSHSSGTDNTGLFQNFLADPNSFGANGGAP